MKVLVTIAWVAEVPPKTRPGASEIATKSRPTSAATAPVLALKKPVS